MLCSFRKIRLKQSRPLHPKMKLCILSQCHRQFNAATPSCLTSAQHEMLPQSVGLGRTSHGAYLFVCNVASIARLRVVSTGLRSFHSASPLREGWVTDCSLLLSAIAASLVLRPTKSSRFQMKAAALLQFVKVSCSDVTYFAKLILIALHILSSRRKCFRRREMNQSLVKAERIPRHSLYAS